MSPAPRTRFPLTPTLLLVLAGCASAIQIEKRSTVNTGTLATADSAVARERGLGARWSQRRSISVLPFTVKSSDTTYLALGYGFAELLLTDLAVSHQLTVVERMRLDAVSQELALNASGRTDPATAVRVGRLVAAHQLVLGALDIPADSSLTFDTDVANVATGALSTALAGRATVNQAFAVERQLVMRLFTELGVTLTPAELKTLDQTPPPDPRAFLAFSRGVRDESHGDLRSAASNYDAAATIDPKFQVAVQHKQNVIQRAAQAGVDLRAAAVRPEATKSTDASATTSATSTAAATATTTTTTTTTTAASTKKIDDPPDAGDVGTDVGKSATKEATKPTTAAVAATTAAGLVKVASKSSAPAVQQSAAGASAAAGTAHAVAVPAAVAAKTQTSASISAIQPVAHARASISVSVGNVTTATKEPATKEPATKKPVAKEAVAKDTAAKETEAKEPAAKTHTTPDSAKRAAPDGKEKSTTETKETKETKTKKTATKPDVTKKAKVKPVTPHKSLD